MTPAKGFAEMKDSGIEWIGEIPTTWTIRRIKNCYRVLGGNGFPPDIQGNLEGDYPVCKASDISVAGKFLKTAANYISCQTAIEYKFNIIPAQSILFAKIGEAMKKNNRTICMQDCCVDNNCQGLIPINIDSNYSYYMLTCIDMEWFDNAGTIPCINNSKLKGCRIPYPSFPEQSAIASFLDTQCAKIDEIIAQAKASIEDYKQWKASIIYEAVTKGLDPNVEMKDSGIPCVDEIPKSWTVTRFGKIATVKSNLVNPKDYQSYKQISPENIEKGSGVLLDCGTVEESGVISGNHLFYKGQILYSKIRPTLNKVIIAPFDGLCSADMYPIDTDHCSRFILYLMLSAYFNEQVALVTGNRVKMPKINQNELSQIMVAIPSGTEEQQIAKYLDSSCSQIDVLIKEKKSLIDDLESYKKSLIYEVVTGKRSVRQ